MAEKSVYDMSDEEYDRLEQNALVRWRVSYPKTATEADNEAAASYCTDNYSASDMAEAYTDGYRTGYLCAESSRAGDDDEPDPDPTCVGEWLSGSGGHRVFGGCGRAASWVEHGTGAAFCDEHGPRWPQPSLPVAEPPAKAGGGGEARYPTCKSCGQVYVEDKGWRNCASCPTPCPKPEPTKPVAEPSSPGHDELRRWREQGRAPAGSCPFCASRISVIERDGIFVARCSHRGCGARGPKHHDLTRACDLFCCPPQRTAGGMGGTDAMTDHPSKPIEYERGHFRGRLVFQPYAELAAATDADLTDIALALQSLDAEDRMRVLEQVPEWRELEDSAEYNGGVAADEHVKRGVAQAALTAAQSDAEKARDAKLTAEESCRQVLKTIADACDQESLAARRARSRA
jgi:hypothetical protein